MTTTHPNTDLLRRLYATVQSGDVDTLAGLHTEDFRLVVSGHSAISGEFQGAGEAARQAARSWELTAGQLELRVERLLADDAVGVAVLTARARRPDGRETTQRLLHECHFSGGRISLLREWIWDQEADQAFWA